MQNCGWSKIVSLLSLLALSATGSAQTYVNVEGSAIWQSRNDQRIPGNTGTQFSISDFDAGPFAGYRVYTGRKWANHHEIRALYAPFATEVSGKFSETVQFQNASFQPNVETRAFYKFNSYRLTYAYHFDRLSDWHLALGFSGKIRDAEVRLGQGNLSRSKSNVGFVPLLNFQARYEVSDRWQFRFDFDGLAAPQGRAIDAGIFLERKMQQAQIFTGYRMIEGGADNDKVYNFAWIHQAVLGLKYEF